MKKSFWLIPIAAIACAAIINVFFIVNAFIPSDSMAPTIESGCFVIGDKNAYNDADPKTGDVVFFLNEKIEDSLMIKRIVATPGQRFKMTNGQVYIDGVLLDEPYINTFSDDNYEEITVPNDSYIVLGDNRPESNDSRTWDYPFIRKDQIKAKASLIWFPKFKVIDME